MNFQKHKKYWCNNLLHCQNRVHASTVTIVINLSVAYQPFNKQLVTTYQYIKVIGVSKANNNSVHIENITFLIKVFFLL